MTRSRVRPPAAIATHVPTAPRTRQDGAASGTGSGAGTNLNPAERAQLGKDARKVSPLDSHAELRPGRDPDPVTTLAGQDADRVPELVPIRYGRMLVSPFTFFRGAAAIMATDLALTPVSGLRTQTCGDAHLSNSGLFASAERTLVFDLTTSTRRSPALGNGT